MDQQEQEKGGKHIWTVAENEMLVDCLVQLKTEGKYIADTGFGGGYVKKLEEMLKEKSPGCGLKANPHIMSRLKTLKAAWQVVHDMVYGVSGFGWDRVTMCVTTEPPVWEEYVKVKPKAGNFRNKRLPHFEKLTYVWGKDRATGKGAQLLSEMIDDVDDEVDLGTNLQAEFTTDQEVQSSEQPSSGPSEVQSSRKRKHSNYRDAIDVLADAMKEASTNTDRSLVKVVESMCKTFVELRRDPMTTERDQELYKELLKVQGLTMQEVNKAAMKMADSHVLLNGFSIIPDELKAEWVLSILENFHSAMEPLAAPRKEPD